MTTVNQSICGDNLLGSEHREVKDSGIESIRREDFNVQMGWLAGFIDGEGNINVGFYKNGATTQGEDWKTFRVAVVITNTHAETIKKATEVLSALKVNFTVVLRSRNNPKWRPCFALTIQGNRNAYKFLKAITPYLIGKKEIAMQALYACEYRDTLVRAGNNQFKKEKIDRIQDNPVLIRMSERAKELVNFRPNIFEYSRQASKPMYVKRPSTTTRLNALRADDIV